MLVAQGHAASGYEHEPLLRDCLFLGLHEYTPQRLLAWLPPGVSGDLFLELSAEGP